MVKHCVSPSLVAVGYYAVNMKPEHWIAVGSAATSAILTALGLWLGPRLAVKRSIEEFQSRKWWELRVGTYSVLLEALSSLQWSLTQKLNAEMGSLHFEDWDVEASRLHVSALAKTFSSKGYLLSSRTARAIDKILYVYSDPTIGSGVIDRLNIEIDELGKCIAIVKDEALKAWKEKD
jgi:hypothetical protein